ncbi:hypothetical protein ETB97_004296 [Aspergillus alliaceus]|uniref:Uncharacterized protein n=1 Tax=Petromyces alliaceus TaxID=209559 RepID=A0A8H6A373_PETAA|nr:hypothetical protein ETB97_004296 [Aspergillus burnettii]
MQNFSAATVPFAWLVDFVSALKYMPDGFLGTGFKQIARRWNKINQTVVNVPYSFFLQQTTTNSHRPRFILAMIMFPEVQHKAQKKIDKVIGTDRLPLFEDRDKLPYIENVVKKHTGGPLSLN